MPRVLFSERPDLEGWLGKFGDPQKYVVYRTSKGEVILEPTRSTQPLRYAYFRSPTNQTIDQIVANLGSKGYIVVKCQEYHWHTDRDIGALTPDEDEG